MNRRDFLNITAAGTLGAALSTQSSAARLAPPELPEPSAKSLPRWRGFNLLEMFLAQNNPSRFREEDFANIAELGFNFVRLPLDYRVWTDKADWSKLREEQLKWVDEAVDFGRKHRIHVQLNFHRAPGYTVAAPAEAKSLWTDAEARKVCAQHWGHFAKRYAGRPNRELSFNLFNEPAKVAAEPHKEVVAIMTETIHKIDADRLIVCDGRDWGTKPPTELVGLGVAAATRGYAPFHLTHYQANWVEGSDRWAKPDYPLKENGTTWDRSTLKRDQVGPWKALQAQGVGVMVGEFGAFSKTPHKAVLAWMSDCLATWKEAGWGWALWNFRGGFGVFDSDRADVTYETARGHKLDRAMLELLQAS